MLADSGLFDSVEAVSFDLFNTLIYHREGRGRGAVLMDYLVDQGLAPHAWEHRFLYDIFDRHDADYSPTAESGRREAYLGQLATRVFDRLGISLPRDEAERHVIAVWDILGPTAFGVFPDSIPAMRDLKALGIPLVLISNWQKGVRHYCHELGLSEYLDHIVGSADVGIQKPERGIFDEAAKRLGLAPGAILHVGDTSRDDYDGGSEAGFQTLLIDRSSDPRDDGTRVIDSLAVLPALLAARD